MKRILRFLLSALVLLSILPCPVNAEEEYPFSVYFLDVGQGDCAVVIADGEVMIIDGGDKEYSSLVYRFLKDKNIHTVAYMVATHADSDHIGGLGGVFYAAKVEHVLCPVTENNTKVFNTFLKQLRRNDLSITVPDAGDSFMLGSAQVRVLMPLTGESMRSNTSIVLRIIYGEYSFLFMGDSEKDEEYSLLESGAELGSTVLKVGHHGSSSSTSHDFLKAVNPAYAVISVGGNNDFHHPTERTLRTLKSLNVKLFRTDIYGTITCNSDGNTLVFGVEKNSSKNAYAFVGGYTGK